MKISEDTAAVVNFLDETAGLHLRKKDDFASLLEILASHGTPDEASELIFTGSSLWNIQRTLKNGSDEENRELLIKELAGVTEKFLYSIQNLIVLIDDDKIKSRFQTIYFVQTEGAFRNLLDLAHDFSDLKKVQNTFKFDKDK